MKMKNKHIKIIFRLIVIGLIGYVVYSNIFFNPFDFGPCDGNGAPNRYEKIYYDNGQLKVEGQLKDCVWHGMVKTYYETGELKSKEQSIKGRKHGTSIMYYTNGNIYKKEEYLEGELIRFNIYSLDSSIQYGYIKANQLLFIKDSGSDAQIYFIDSLNLSGYDEPFAMLIGNDLILRGKKDFYVINSNLEIKIDLRDTLMKYIPSAYVKKIDNSGNVHDFLWHRDIEGDSIKLKVFYDGDENQSMHKTWEKNYRIK
jgi:hypothetical protein